MKVGGEMCGRKKGLKGREKREGDWGRQNINITFYFMCRI